MQPDKTPPVSPRKIRLYGTVAIGVLAAVVTTGIITRSNGDVKLREWTDAQAVPSVAVTLPGTKPLNATLDLPGRLEAYSRAPIFARVSGYLKSWKFDIGAQVKAGEQLAEIDAPDLDQQLLQARADLTNAQAAAKLSAATLTRRKTLLASNFVSQQEIDERSADLASKEAQVNSMTANVQRLEALASYKNVTAPFDGVVTERNTDVGALINGGTGSGAAMFVVSDVKKLRLYVNVPQSYLPGIRIGAKATVTVPEYAGRTFPATVEASAQSVDISSGTTRMQLAIENPNNELRPGAYANVKLALTRDVQPLSIPASALIFNNSGLRVATVSPGDKVLFKNVTIARDLGREIEIATGLSADDRIIITPLDGIADGDAVRIAGAGKDGTPRTSSNATTKTE
ncbi:efflux RND transporter periplasmic adaptor subunit [Bradyrhizobium sp. G127]|jgi:RND family efflux transporter MFP subunit|uniref:efflux RND transporter periplasmic adaptor subunit n=1 Tax=Bradyrhizobium sp. G127 TaxID=2904800 RepID=UPI001F35F514|nr:efflux RND transporter periplasmic adaptor subunit [Bradyrhizobium sp. G127]MCF2523420.1 efflux RND transporter periplasmic adaptor subunit [Bradyrhizobium sp. G127]